LTISGQAKPKEIDKENEHDYDYDDYDDYDN
jgi:hypothetical protein